MLVIAASLEQYNKVKQFGLLFFMAQEKDPMILNSSNSM